MSNHNKHEESDRDTAAPLLETIANSQQVSIKAWLQKLLVALLCVVSFYGGYKSYESRMVNQCFASGGKMVEGEKTLLCELS